MRAYSSQIGIEGPSAKQQGLRNHFSECVCQECLFGLFFIPTSALQKLGGAPNDSMGHGRSACIGNASLVMVKVFSHLRNLPHRQSASVVDM